MAPLSGLRPRLGSFAVMGNHDHWRDAQAAHRALAGHAVLLLGGHEHNYQRFRPFRGIVQMVVGTGGRPLSNIDRTDTRPARALEDDFGAVRLELSPGRLEHAFETTTRGTQDSGTIGCTGGPDVTIGAPLTGKAYSRRLSRFAGLARGAAGPVRLTLVRRSGRGCRVLSGGRFVAASCATRRRTATAPVGPGRWSYRLGLRLPRGSYTLTARRTVEGAADVTGTSRFRIR